MAGKIPAGDFNTRISLDGEQSVQTLRSLKSEVSGLTSAWKAQETQLKTAGDNLGAAKVKYDGLSDSVNKQKDYLSQLKNEQAQIDQSTNKGAESYAKLGTQIQQANSKLASMESQQAKAKESWKYYESGVADSQKALKQITETSQSYVTRLQAEGREEEANKVKMNGLKSSYSEMQSLYEKQTSELQRIASESGKTSDAYHKQEIRLNDVATQMARTKSEMSGLSGETQKVSESPFKRLWSSIHKTNDEAGKTPGIFKSVLGANVISDVALNAWATLSGEFKDIIKEGLELNEGGEKTKATWESMGKSQEAIKGLSTQMAYLRSESGLTGGTIINMQRQLDTMTAGNTDKTKELATGITAVGVASRLSDDGVGAFVKGLVKANASGKITTGTLAKLEKAAPALGEQLASAAGVSQSAFNKMVSDGTITSDKFQDLLIKVGKSSGKTFDDFGKTSEGAMAQINGSWTSLKSKMTAPLLEVKNTGMSALSKLLTSSAVQNAAVDLGKGLATASGYGIKLVDYVANHSTQITGIATDVWSIAKTFGMDVWQTVSGFAKVIAEQFGLLSSNAAKSKDPMNVVKDVMDNLAKNKDGIKKASDAFIAMVAVKGLANFVTSTAQLAASFKTISSFKQPKIDKVATIADSVESVGPVSGVGTAAKEVGTASKFAKGVGTVAKGASLVGAGATVGFDIFDAFKSKSPDSKFKNWGKSIGTLIGGGVGLYFGGPQGAAIGAGIGHFIGEWGGKGAKQFVDGWNKQGKKTKPTSFIETVGLNAHNITNSIGKVISPITKSIGKFLAPVNKVVASWGNSLKKTFGKVWKEIEPVVNSGMKLIGNIVKVTSALITSTWNVAWKTMSTAVSISWKIIKPAVDIGIGAISGAIKGGMKIIGSVWNEGWKIVGSVIGAVWKTFKPLVKGTMDTISSVIKTVLDIVHGNWSNVWTDIKNIGVTIWKTITGTISGAINGISNVISTVLGSISKVWNSTWGGLSDFFSGIWSGIKNAARDGLNDVIGIINSGIGGINGVIHLFGGKKETIGLISKIKKFATGTGAISGTRRAITQPTVAMLNDGPEADNRELVVKNDGRSYMHPGKNVLDVLSPGDEVLNASETKMLFNNAGITHFATGTGVFGWIQSAIGGVADKLKLITNAVAHPIQSFENMIGSKMGLGGIAGEIPKALGNMMKNSVTGQMEKWWQTMWNLFDDSVNGGGEGGPWAHTPGAGWGVSSPFGNRGAVAGGYSAHDGVDFSGASLVHAMHGGTVTRVGGAPAGWGGASGIGESVVVRGDDGYSVIYQELNGKYDSGAGIRVKTGDTVKTGDALATLGPSGNHVHVGVTKHPMFSIGGSSTAGWEDITQMHGTSDGSSKKSKTDKGLAALVKSQLGSGVFNWLSKFIAPLTGGGGDSEGGPMKSLPQLEAIARKAASIMKVDPSDSFIKELANTAMSESGGNAGVANNWDGNAKAGMASVGLLQYIPSTWSYYAMPGHNNRSSVLDNFVTFFNNSDWKNSIGYVTYPSWNGAYKWDWRNNGPHGARRFANGGYADQPSIFGEAGPEMAIPLSATKRSRAFELLGQVNAMFGTNNDDKSGQNRGGELQELLETNNSLLQAIVALLTAIGTDGLSAEVPVQIGGKTLSTYLTTLISKGLAKEASNVRRVGGARA